MADNTNLRGPADAARININQEHEISYWCSTLGCTRAQLIAAVSAVGPMVTNVRRYLGK